MVENVDRNLRRTPVNLPTGFVNPSEHRINRVMLLRATKNTDVCLIVLFIESTQSTLLNTVINDTETPPTKPIAGFKVVVEQFVPHRVLIVLRPRALKWLETAPLSLHVETEWAFESTLLVKLPRLFNPPEWRSKRGCIPPEWQWANKTDVGMATIKIKTSGPDTRYTNISEFIIAQTSATIRIKLGERDEPTALTLQET